MPSLATYRNEVVVLPAWLQRFAVLDFEGTSPIPPRSRIVQIAVLLVDEGEVREERVQLINPQLAIPEESSKVHGIYDHHVAAAPTFADVARLFIDSIRGRFVVGYHVVNYDMVVLNCELERVHLPPVFIPCLDLLKVVRAVDKGLGSASLGAACARRALLGTTQPHDALGDVRLTYALLKALVAERPLLFDAAPKSMDDVTHKEWLSSGGTTR